MLPHLCRPVPMMRDRLDRLIVLGLVVARGRRPIAEIVAHAVTPKDLRRDQPRADVAAVVAQNKAVKAGLLRRPVRFRRNEDRPARSSGRSPKDKRMDALAAEHLDIRHLPRLLLHHDRAPRASDESCSQEQTGKEFGAHKTWFNE